MDIKRDLARVALQEERLRFAGFDAASAWKLGVALKEASEKRRVGVALDISTPSYTLFSHAMAGATPGQCGMDATQAQRDASLSS